MIISHKHKFIFLKTRKTAGTSLEIALSRFCGESDIITPIGPDEELRKRLSPRGAQNFRAGSARCDTKNGRPQKPKDYYNHIPAARVQTLIGTTLWDEYYKFCIERNPWDRAVSLYFWLTRKRNAQPTLLAFLRSEVARGEKSRLSNYNIYSIGDHIAVNYVGFYENLSSEIEHITTVLRLPEKIELPEAKGSTRKDRRHYREIMTPKERDIVAEACAKEIACFGYSF